MRKNFQFLKFLKIRANSGRSIVIQVTNENRLGNRGDSANAKEETVTAVSWIAEHGPLSLFAAFVVIHALADFPLQGEYLARQKLRRLAHSRCDWIIALSAHCVIQAGGVWLVSGSLAMGAVELVLHGLIDLGKGEGKFGTAADQLLHLGCKLGYVLWLTYG